MGRANDDEETYFGSRDLGLCGGCSSKGAIYTCPACFARTCSVRCSKEHKLRSVCSGRAAGFDGEANRVYRMSDSTIADDIKFIDKLNVVVESASRRIARELSSRITSENGLKSTFTGNSPSFLRKKCKERNIKLKTAPSLHTARKLNTTRITKRAKCILWRVQLFVFLGSISGSCGELLTTSQNGSLLRELPTADVTRLDSSAPWRSELKGEQKGVSLQRRKVQMVDGLYEILTFEGVPEKAPLKELCTPESGVNVWLLPDFEQIQGFGGWFRVDPGLSLSAALAGKTILEVSIVKFDGELMRVVCQFPRFHVVPLCALGGAPYNLVMEPSGSEEQTAS